MAEIVKAWLGHLSRFFTRFNFLPRRRTLAVKSGPALDQSNKQNVKTSLGICEHATFLEN
jgi:hypothetical protein